MSDVDIHKLSDRDQALLARAVMRRQGALSLRVAAVFVILVLGVPLVNAYAPNLANTPVLGFTATWLFLGVLIYPITVGLSYYFVNQSNKIEASCVDLMKAQPREEEVG